MAWCRGGGSGLGGFPGLGRRAALLKGTDMSGMRTMGRRGLGAVTGAVTGAVSGAAVLWACAGTCLAVQPIASPAMAAAAAVSIAAPDEGRAESLKLRRITLYRSGVGAFEHRGLVNGDEDVSLTFKADQINDILKSMVLLDLSGQGRIEAVGYGSKEPLSKRLSSFGIDLSGNPTLAGILRQARGARVSLKTVEGEVVGTILGVEERTVAEEQQYYKTDFVNVLTDRGMRSVRIDRVSTFDLLDEKLADELRLALAAVAEQRNEDTKAVDLRFRGAGAREVAVAYVHEAPVWKASYRLVLPDAEAGGRTGGTPVPPKGQSLTGGTPVPPGDKGGTKESVQVQGWAIVENTTDEDWRDVRLSLVSGQPVSFVMDLYEPLFLGRPEVPVPVIAGVRPRVYERGQESKLSSANAVPPASVASRARATHAEELVSNLPAIRSDAGGAYDALSSEDLSAYAAAAQAAASEAGEVFKYDLKEPVTIERQRSAMLPILQGAMQGRRVSIYNPADGLPHPMRGVEVTNTTELELLPGPVAVYDSGAYAGDAQIGQVSPGETRLLAYSVDVEVDLTQESTGDSSVLSLRVVDGSIVRSFAQERTTTYIATNADGARGRTVLVEHPKEPWAAWELVEGEGLAKAASESATSRRFELAVEAGKTARAVVRERHTTAESFAVTDLSPDDLLVYEREGKVSPAAAAAIRKAMTMMAAVRTAEERVADLERERSEISAEQARIRQNMTTLDKASQLYGRYIKKLDEQETRLEDLGRDLTGARQDEASRRNELARYLSDLRVD